MKLKATLLFVAMLLLSWNTFSQVTEAEKFKAHGQGIVKIFTNYHSTFSDGESSRVFEIQRAYLGYQFLLSEKLSGKLVLDVGDPHFGDLEMTAYLKNAFVQYASGKLVAKMGMIGLHQFKLQESQWGGRYLYKSFMDEHEIGPSADLGVFVGYHIHEKLDLDLTIANGNGYKHIQSDTTLKYSLGASLKPISGLVFRSSYDYMGQEAVQQTLAFYLGYSAKKVDLGAEYNYQWNHDVVQDHHLSGLSLYGSYHIKQMRVFGRYDNLSSPIITGDTDPWNDEDDGHLIIAGLEFHPVKGLMVSPNYQGWIPADGSPVWHSVYLSLEIKI
jgi:hypothetical protein